MQVNKNWEEEYARLGKRSENKIKLYKSKVNNQKSKIEKLSKSDKEQKEKLKDMEKRLAGFVKLNE